MDMQSLAELSALVKRFAAAIPGLNLEGDELEDYSTVLLWLQNQVETGAPNETIVNICMNYFKRFESQAA